MKPLPHRYEVHLTGRQAGYAEVTTGGVPLLRTAPPVEYDGPGDAWTPEHLLLAAVQSCFLFTLRAVARVAKMEFSTLEVEATGTVDRTDGVTRFSAIVLRPRIAVAPTTGRERVLDVLRKTEKACLVSASLSTPVRVEPTIEEGTDMRTHEPASPMEEPLAELERQLISGYVAAAGESLPALLARNDAAARQLLTDASVYAASRLTEVESRFHYLRNLRGEL